MFSFLLVMAYFGAVALLSWGAGRVIKHLNVEKANA